MCIRDRSPIEISALCTNLAKGCEKQYKPEEAALFTELADYYQAISASAKDPSFDKLLALIEKDLEEGFPDANAVAIAVQDRGARCV